MLHTRIQSAALAEAATPASWVDTSAARLALAACVAADIRATVHTTTYALTRDQFALYDGPLADAVAAAREAWLVEQGGGEDTRRYMALHFEQPTVTQAIDAAYRHAYGRESALYSEKGPFA